MIGTRPPPCRGAADLRLRRGRLRGRRGAGRALRPRARRDAPLPGASAAPRHAGCSSTRRRRSCPRSRRDSASTRRSSSPAAVSRSTRRRRSSRSAQGSVVLSGGRAHRDPHAGLDRGSHAEPDPSRARAAGRRARARCASTRSFASRATTTSGRSATARACRTRPRPASPTRRPPSTRCDRRDDSPGTSPATPKPYRYRTLGQVATLGRYKGIALVFGLPLRGFIGWFVTRTYHLYQLPLFSRKLRVVTDWTVALLFRRDIAELGMLGHPTRLGDD